MQIDAIGVDNLSCADPSGVHPLKELPLHIPGDSPGMSVDGNGLLVSVH